MFPLNPVSICCIPKPFELFQARWLLNHLQWLMASAINAACPDPYVGPSYSPEDPVKLDVIFKLSVVHSVPSSRSSVKILNRIGPKTVPCEGHTLEQAFFEGLYPLKRDPHWSSSWKAVACGKDPMLEQDKNSSPWAAAKTRSDELTVTTISLSPCTIGWEERDAGKEGGVQRRCFKDLFDISLSCSDFDW